MNRLYPAPGYRLLFQIFLFKLLKQKRHPRLIDSMCKNCYVYVLQELANLHSLYMYGNNTLVADSTPRVATVLDQMRDLFR